MKVTPDRLEPIMPMDTRYQGERRLPRKKLALLALRPVSQATAINIRK